MQKADRAGRGFRITLMRDGARPSRYFNQRINNDLLTILPALGGVPANAQDARHHAHPRPSCRHGMNRSSILRAIKRGAITGTKDHNDVWHVDGAELARAFPVTPPNAQPAQTSSSPSRERCPYREERYHATPGDL